MFRITRNSIPLNPFQFIHSHFLSFLVVLLLIAHIRIHLYLYDMAGAVQRMQREPVKMNRTSTDAHNILSAIQCQHRHAHSFIRRWVWELELLPVYKAHTACK